MRIAKWTERHVAPHNLCGPMADLVAAQFGPCVPDVEMVEIVEIVEIELDDVPWKYKLLTQAPVIENGSFKPPTGRGWGADINEDVLAKLP